MALKMDPQNPFYHLHYDVLLDRREDRDGALREIKLAEKLDPSNPLAYFNLGALEVRLGDYAGARQQLEAAVRLNPDLSGAYYARGGVCLGLSEMSRVTYQKFQEVKLQERQEEPDPVEAGVSSSDLHASPEQ